MTSSRIESVTVYRTGARVTRVCSLTAETAALAAPVRIEGLPLCLEDSSVRVRLEREAGGEGAVPIASDVRVVLDVAAADATQPEADDQALAAAEDEVARLRAYQAQAQGDLAALDRLQLRSRPERGKSSPPEASPTAARAALLALRSERRSAIEERLATLRQQLRQAERHLAELRDRDSRTTGARQPREHELRKALVISLQPPEDAADGEGAAGGVRLVAEYDVPGARWAPSYTLRFDEALEQATLQVRAQVAQSSGEDWRDVAIRLSTAQPEQWAELPELQSRRIGRKQAPAARRGWRAPPAGAEALYADFDHARRRQLAAVEMSEPIDDGLAGEVFEELEAFEEQRAFADDVDDAAAGAPPGGYPPAQPLSQSQGKARKTGPAPAKPMAPPQHALMAMSRSSKSGGLLGGLFGGGGGGAADDYMSEGVASYASPALEESRHGGGGGDAPTQTIFIPSPAPATADYGRLRMAAPGEPARGKLIAVEQLALYLELQLTSTLISEQTIAYALADAHSGAAIDTTYLPPRHRLIEQAGYDYAFAGEAPVDVPSDGAFHNLALVASPAKTSPLRVVVPRESLDVFRLARLDHSAEHPLLPGPVDVYVGADYLLTSDVAFTPPGSSVDIGLGVDQAVKVARNTRYREESAGLIKGSLLLHHAIDIEIANHSGGAIDIEVRERVPVLRDEEDDIKLELGKVSPPWKPYEPKPSAEPSERLKGGYCWQLQLGAGESTELSAGYTIRIAAKHELIGGNRRER